MCVGGSSGEDEKTRECIRQGGLICVTELVLTSHGLAGDYQPKCKFCVCVCLDALWRFEIPIQRYFKAPLVEKVPGPSVEAEWPLSCTRSIRSDHFG